MVGLSGQARQSPYTTGWVSVSIILVAMPASCNRSITQLLLLLHLQNAHPGRDGRYRDEIRQGINKSVLMAIKIGVQLLILSLFHRPAAAVMCVAESKSAKKHHRPATVTVIACCTNHCFTLGRQTRRPEPPFMNALIVIDPQNDFAPVARWRLLAVTRSCLPSTP